MKEANSFKLGQIFGWLKFLQFPGGKSFYLVLLCFVQIHNLGGNLWLPFYTDCGSGYVNYDQRKKREMKNLQHF